MFALPMRQPGVVVRRVRQITGRAEFAELFLDGAEAPADCRIGAEGEGWAVAMTTLTAERGAGFAALALHRIGEDLALLRHCADAATVEALAVRLETLRWQVRRSIELQAAGRSSPASSMVLKLTWSELLQDAARAGFSTGCPVHLDRWRHVLLDRREITIASGTSEIQRNLIGERVLGLPR
jgi:alkylation response protein AidB-like acyl-CoA dehydrogenase